MDIQTIPALSDNFIHLLVEGDEAWVVDPGDATPVLSYLKTHNLRLKTILLTHNHADHTAGVNPLRRATHCSVIGPAECATSTLTLDRTVADHDSIPFGPHPIHVLSVPGHTPGHLVFLCETASAVWTGDTLFFGGCGRIMPGAAAAMWHSLCRLRALAPQTRIYCGHDYTSDNLEFAASILPDDPAIVDRLKQAQKQERAGSPSLSSTIAEERQSNLFLRADDAVVQHALGLLHNPDPVAAFAELRRRKDVW